jgi:hypothetical protein
MSSTLGDLIDSQFGTRFLIPWKWLTPNSRQTLEIVFQLTMDSEQDFSEGFALHHLYYVNLNDVKAIRYLDGHRINIALEEIKKIVTLGQYQELPTLDDREFKAEININTFEVYDDMIRKATNIEDLAEAILARLEAEFNISVRNREIICERVQWYNANPLTLEAIGKKYGITRERIRQITKNFESPKISISGKIKFIEDLEPLLPISTSLDDLGLLGAKSGLTSEEEMDLVQCNALIDVVSSQDFLDRYFDRIQELLDLIEETDEIVSAVSKFRRKMGFIDANYVASELSISEESAVEATRKKYPRSVISNSLILARTESHVSTFESAIGKQLLLIPELDANILLDGAKRFGTMRNDPMTGEESDYINIIHSICGNPPNLDTFRQNQLYEVEFSESDKWLIRVFKSSPNGLMHRIELTRVSIESRINLGSITAYCGSNPLIRSHSSGIYSLVGNSPSKETVTTHAELALIQDRAFSFSLEYDGSNLLFTFSPNLNMYASGVIMPSREIKELVAGYTFTPTCQCGAIETKQILRLTNEGFWLGYQSIFSHAFQEHEYGVDSEFRLFFNFDLKTATLQP